MFEPKYQITARLLENIKRIAVLISELNKQNLSKTVLFEMEELASAVSAHTSTAIEGNPLPLTDVKKLLKNKPENIRDTEKEVVNYNQALDYLKALKNHSLIDKKLILEIHKIIMKGLMSKTNTGKLRQDPVFVNNPRTGQTVYWPPEQSEVSKLIQDLVSFVKTNQSKLDPLILSGIVHKQFVIIHPFIDGNGRTARLLAKHLLANLGLNTFNLFSFENYYNKNTTKYFEKVGLRGNYYDLKVLNT